MMRTALRHARSIAVNLFYLAVVWLVLNQFDRRPEAVILPVLGMLYVEIRRTKLEVSAGFPLISVILGDICAHLNVQTGTIYGYDVAQVFADMKEDRPRMLARLYIDVFFLTVIFLLCLWKFFNAL